MASGTEAQSATGRRRCYEYGCRRFPDCLRANVSCCAVDFDDYEPIAREECYDLPGNPLYLPGRSERAAWLRRPVAQAGS